MLCVVWVVVLVKFCHYRSHQTRTCWIRLLESLPWQNRFYKRNGTGSIVICKRRQGALIFKGIIRLCYSPSPQAYACGVCSCWTTAAGAATTAATTAASSAQPGAPESHCISAGPGWAGFRNGARHRSGPGAPHGPLWRQGAQERLCLSLSGRRKIPLNIFQLKLRRF